MTPVQHLAAAFAMTPQVWDRHANKWSGWTRMPVLPLLALAIYARVWLGWACLIPIAALLVWTWANPRVFPVPRATDNWMSKSVLGERVWLNASALPIPAHHARAVRLLAALPLAGLVPMIWGLWALDPWAAGLGCLLAVLAKLWFLDRMVWLYDDMAKLHPDYAGWLR